MTAGTIFHRTRTPLTVWFAAAWQLTSQKHGISALGLKRVLGLGSYQTAWAMLHRYRIAMVRPGRERLGGEVEVDETYVGGEDPGAYGRQTSKAIVAIAVEVREPRGFGRARLERMPDLSAASLVPFVCDVVDPGARVLTDGWPSYGPIKDHGYVHEKTVVTASNDPAHVSMPAVHRVASLLKRWLLGTHQGAVGDRTPRRLPERVHLPLQPPRLAAPGAALLPPARAGGRHRPGGLPRDDRQPAAREPPEAAGRTPIQPREPRTPARRPTMASSLSLT